MTAQGSAVAGLDTFSSQRTFRALLDALARPGVPVALPALDPDLPPALVLPLALADVEISVAVLAAPESLDWAMGIVRATGCRVAELEHADLVVALRPPTPEEVRSLRRGSALAPEDGARVAVAVDAFPTEGAALLASLEGPGIATTQSLGVDGLPVEVLETLVAVNARFPAGVDTYLFSIDGAVVGLPRTTRIRIERGSSTWATQP